MCSYAAISTRGEQQRADKQRRQSRGGQHQVSKAPFLRRSLNRLRSKDLLFRELRTLKQTATQYPRDFRRLSCGVMLWAGRRCVGLLDIGNHCLNLRGIALLHIGNHRLNLRGIAHLHIGNHRINLRGIAHLHIGNHRLNLRGIAHLHIGNHRLNLRGIAVLHIGNRRLNQPPQCRLNLA